MTRKKLQEKNIFGGNPDNQPEIVDFEDGFGWERYLLVSQGEG